MRLIVKKWIAGERTDCHELCFMISKKSIEEIMDTVQKPYAKRVTHSSVSSPKKPWFTLPVGKKKVRPSRSLEITFKDENGGDYSIRVELFQVDCNKDKKANERILIVLGLLKGKDEKEECIKRGKKEYKSIRKRLIKICSDLNEYEESDAFMDVNDVNMIAQKNGLSTVSKVLLSVVGIFSAAVLIYTLFKESESIDNDTEEDEDESEWDYLTEIDQKKINTALSEGLIDKRMASRLISECRFGVGHLDEILSVWGGDSIVQSFPNWRDEVKNVSKKEFESIVDNAAKLIPKIKDVSIFGDEVRVKIESKSGKQIYDAAYDFYDDEGFLTTDYCCRATYSSAMVEQFGREVQKGLKKLIEDKL